MNVGFFQEKYIRRLKAILATQESSEFFKSHEVHTNTAIFIVHIFINDFLIFPLIFTHENINYQVTNVIQTYYHRYLTSYVMLY